MKVGITYDFPILWGDEADRLWRGEKVRANGDRVRDFARYHGLTATRFNPPNEEQFIRVWFGENTKLAVRARDRYHALRGGHYAIK